MKKNLLLMGLVSVLLLAGMMFTACSSDDGDDGLPVPGPADLPALPSGSNYVSSEAEAKTLLGALRNGFASVRYEVEELIWSKAKENETENGYSASWNVSGDTSIDYLEVTASGSETESGSIGEIPQAGDSEEEAWNSNTTIKFTGDKSVSGGTIYTGSSMAAKETGSGRITVKGIDTESMSATINVNESINEYYAYGLTVSANGKGGKIILDASAQGAINKDVKMSGPSDFPDMDITYSGSLKVYGADDTEYTIVAIASEDDYDEALSYFRGY